MTTWNHDSIRQLADGFGFKARFIPSVGFFLAPVTKDRFNHRHIGDDAMLVKFTGEIESYADDAQAFLAATAVRSALIGADDDTPPRSNVQRLMMGDQIARDRKAGWGG